MNTKQLQKLIRQGEGKSLEFKEGFGSAVITALNAFANTSGGVLLIGISDDGSVKGVSTGGETVQGWLNEIKQKTEPSIIPDVESVSVAGKTVVVLSIKECPVKPIAMQGRYYRRVKNSNHQLSAQEVSDLYLQSMQLSWDAYPYTGGVFKDIDLTKVSAFMKNVNERGRFRLVGNPRKNLAKLGLIKNGKPTNAAMVLFARSPLHYDVHVGRFKTSSTILDDRIIRGGLFDVTAEVMRYIVGHLKVAYEITGKTTQRTEIYEYPMTALRELVLNALIHRDYTSPVDVQIKIFDQRIEIFSPGKLYGNLTVEDLKTDAYQSHARNKLIVEAFYLTGDIEKYGTGYIRVRNAIKEYPTMDFNYREIGDGYITELKYESQKTTTVGVKGDDRRLGVRLGVKLGVRLGVNQKLILDRMQESPQITIPELSKSIKISTTAIEKNIAQLRGMKLLERIGADKNGYWKVKEKV